MSNPIGRRLRVVLLDDHLMVLNALERMFKRDFGVDVTGSFRTSEELFKAMKGKKADVIVTDYALATSKTDGLRLIRAFKQRFPDARVLVISSHYNAATVSMAKQAGADGFVGKTQPASELSMAIRAVASGRTYFDHRLADAVETNARPDEIPGGGLLSYAKLSPREWEVLRCILDGMSVTAVAKKFSRAISTISAQKKAALRKLGIRNINELFKMQYRDTR